MRRKLLGAACALVIAACTFPEVTYLDAKPGDASSADGSSGGDESPTGSDASDEVGRGGDGAVDAMSRDTSTAADVQPPTDALDAYVFEAAADAPPCDQDQDGYSAIGACGGGDCDDEDPRAYPGEPNYVTALPRATTMGDWNCNHVVEKQFPINVTCSPVTLNCSTVSGFAGDPPCGTSGTFVQCMTMNWGLCGVGASSMQVQACK